jgi:hypothetical protein
MLAVFSGLALSQYSSCFCKNLDTDLTDTVASGGADVQL